MEEKKRLSYRGLLDESGLGSGCGPKLYTACILIAVLVLFSGCKTKEFVPVVEKHTETIHHHDSIFQLDSVIHEKTTLIREVDSATMAKYGIQLKDMERAWLIQSDKLEREISRLESQKSDTVIITDSVPKIVVKEIERELSIKEKLQNFFYDALLGIIIFIVIVLMFRLIKKKRL